MSAHLTTNAPGNVRLCADLRLRALRALGREGTVIQMSRETSTPESTTRRWIYGTDALPVRYHQALIAWIAAREAAGGS